ncbi:protein-glutamate methylesterase [Mycolicibacterium mucogenicum]|uniref:protein-glutamate methylesterase n=1 Tax=Mycolicibacterium mucogenicum TaxID=56689 RepID=A0A1A3GG64_MYCMU|nr:chemotaxis protein CheB [Mycolicibacterium mucogenicum]OBJ35037.1 protein-glutamate methylesterase [Mycolicibacterium mucogenicum]
MADRNGLRGVVAVGASAGGVEALSHMAAELPADLPLAVLVVLHMPVGVPSVLARILDRAGPLDAVAATNGAELRPGTVYTCVPDRHLLIDDHRVLLTRGPTENGHRPAINALFRSAAITFGPRAIGVLLSGVLDDGVLGLKAIQSRGGSTIAQSPRDAMFSALPSAALSSGVVDHEARASAIGVLLKELSEEVNEEPLMDPHASLLLENRIAMAEPFATDFDAGALGPPSGYTCPDCNGSLSTISDGNYRCHVGHAWSGEALIQARGDEVDGALCVAVRSLQEKAQLARRMASSVSSGMLQQRFSNQADEAEHALRVLTERLTMAGAGD